MQLDKRLQNIFDELEAKAYNPTYHNYYYKEANQIIRKHVEALIIDSVSGSLTSKEAIEYEIYAKRKDKEENLKGWVCAIFFTFMLFVGLFELLKICSS